MWILCGHEEFNAMKVLSFSEPGQDVRQDRGVCGEVGSLLLKWFIT